MIGGRARQTVLGNPFSMPIVLIKSIETRKVPNRPYITMATSNDISSQSRPTTTDEAVEVISTIVTTTSIASTSISTTAFDIDHSRFDLGMFRQGLSED